MNVDSGDAFLCRYCASWLEEGHRSEEHPLPRALGGSGWSTRDVCDQCNARVGVEVDQPFCGQTLILERRHDHRVPDGRGSIPDAPVVVSELETGEAALSILDRDGWKAVLVPSETWNDDRSELTVTLDPANSADYLEKKLERLRRTHGPDAAAAIAEGGTMPSPLVNVALPVNGTLWPRFAAKLALAFGAEVLGPGWLSSDRATFLRAVLGGAAASADGPFPPLAPASAPISGEMRLYFAPPEHVVGVIGGPLGATLAVFLFSEQSYSVPLASGPAPETRAWVFSPIAGTATSTSWSEWEQAAAVRAVEAASRQAGS